MDNNKLCYDDFTAICIKTAKIHFHLQSKIVQHNIDNNFQMVHKQFHGGKSETKKVL